MRSSRGLPSALRCSTRRPRTSRRERTSSGHSFPLGHRNRWMRHRRRIHLHWNRNRRQRWRSLRALWTFRTFHIRNRAHRSRIHGPSHRGPAFPCKRQGGDSLRGIRSGAEALQPFPAVVEGLEAEGDDAEDGDYGEGDDGVEEGVVVGCA